MNIIKMIQSVTHEVDAIQGNQTKDKTFSSEQVWENEEMARDRFRRAKEKLYAVQGWSDLPGFTATFTVYDPKGNPSDATPVRRGDYIRIDLPGPLPPNWVRIVDMDSTETVAHFTVVPCSAPVAETNEEAAPVEHFFTAEASSTFQVEQRGNRVIASEIGRNERVNNEQATAGDRAVLNTLIAAGGWALFQEAQWTKLTDYLVAP